MSDIRRNIVPTLIEVCHRVYAKGFVTATDGNVSVRLENGNFLTTRTSVNKGMVTADDLVEVDDEGNPVRNTGFRTPESEALLRPSTELGMHLFIYARRPDVCAVVHAHPPYATGFAAARQALDACIFPEVIVGLGAVPLAEYATPSTDEIAASLAPHVMRADAILLANHGVVTYGKDLMDAYFKMEKVEHAAHITFIARMLGGEKALSSEQVDKLRAISQSSYGKDFSGKPSCEPARAMPAEKKEDASSGEIPTGEEIRSLVRQMLQGKQ